MKLGKSKNRNIFATAKLQNKTYPSTTPKIYWSILKIFLKNSMLSPFSTQKNVDFNRKTDAFNRLLATQCTSAKISSERPTVLKSEH